MGTRRSYDLVAARYAAELGGEFAGKVLGRALFDVGCGLGALRCFGCLDGGA
jgi:hypothetical protein